jgi:hypothetical protein
MARAEHVGSTATQGRDDITLNPAVYTPGGPTGDPQARRRFPEFSGINHCVQNRESQYHALQLSLNRRYANGFTARVNYTLADLQGTIDGPELLPYFHSEYEQMLTVNLDSPTESNRRVTSGGNFGRITAPAIRASCSSASSSDSSHVCRAPTRSARGPSAGSLLSDESLMIRRRKNTASAP